VHAGPGWCSCQAEAGVGEVPRLGRGSAKLVWWPLAGMVNSCGGGSSGRGHPAPQLPSSMCGEGGGFLGAARVVACDEGSVW
jgi:hypothetical protein